MPISIIPRRSRVIIALPFVDPAVLRHVTRFAPYDAKHFADARTHKGPIRLIGFGSHRPRSDSQSRPTVSPIPRQREPCPRRSFVLTQSAHAARRHRNANRPPIARPFGLPHQSRAAATIAHWFVCPPAEYSPRTFGREQVTDDERRRCALASIDDMVQDRAGPVRHGHPWRTDLRRRVDAGPLPAPRLALCARDRIARLVVAAQPGAAWVVDINERGSQPIARDLLRRSVGMGQGPARRPGAPADSSQLGGPGYCGRVEVLDVSLTTHGSVCRPASLIPFRRSAGRLRKGSFR